MTRTPVDRKVLDAVRNFYAAGLNFRAHIEWANRADRGWQNYHCLHPALLRPNTNNYFFDQQ